MCPILDGYGVMTFFSFPYTPSCEPRRQLAGGYFYSSTKQSALLISKLERHRSNFQQRFSINVWWAVLDD
jgi:hypothetical protein